MATIGSLFVSIGVKTADLEKGLASAKGKLSGFASGAAKVGAVAGGAVVAGAGAMGAAIVAAGDASLDLQRQLGATRRQLGDLSDKELLDAQHSAQLLEKAFGSGMEENIQAAGVLMKEFGLSSTEAFDFLALGFEKGLNNSDDFLDSIGEYSNQFAEGHANAAEFFSVMETGLAGGVLGTDKVADAFKEFRIKALEAGTASGDIVADFNEAISALSQMEDPVARNAMGVELFGTMWEDLGESIIMAVDTGATKMSELDGATDNLGQKWASLGTFFSQGMDQVLLALSPATDAFLQFVNDNQPVLDDFFAKLTPVVTEFADKISEKLPQVLMVIGDGLERIGKSFGIVSENSTGVDAAVEAISWAFDSSITVFEGAAVAVSLLADAIEGLNSGIIDFKGNSSNFAGKIGQLAGQVSGIGGIRSGYNALSGSGIFGFADGGVVPGPKGAAQLAVVHGGETIIPPGMAQAGTNIYIGDIQVGSDSGGGIDEALQQMLGILRARINAAV